MIRRTALTMPDLEQLRLGLEDDIGANKAPHDVVQRKAPKQKTNRTFFNQKREWSRIKDRVIRKYLPAYLPKVASLKREIVLIDAFAGPGRYGNSEPPDWGSPILIAEAARGVRDLRYQAFFFNREPTYHKRLKTLLADDPNAKPMLGQAQELMRLLSGEIGSRTVWLYLDPFGVVGCEMDNFRQFLNRNPQTTSTEIVMNLSTPAIHRLAAVHATRAGRETLQTNNDRSRLTRVLGGDYWQSILSDRDLTPRQRDEALVEKYLAQFRRHLRFTGSCRVADHRGNTKYYITFCSRHPDALTLMNDAMIEAYWSVRAEMATRGTFFDRCSWEDLYEEELSYAELEGDIIEAVRAKPGITRRDVCVKVMEHRFMIFRGRDIRRRVEDLWRRQKVICTAGQNQKNRLNDECMFAMPGAIRRR